MAKIIKALTIVDELIANKIYYIRKQKIILDRDLAELYGVQAIRLREQVKRNLEKFPLKFMFQLTIKEVETLVSQNAIPSKQQLGGFYRMLLQSMVY
jgi:ORF6N domain